MFEADLDSLPRISRSIFSIRDLLEDDSEYFRSSFSGCGEGAGVTSVFRPDCAAAIIEKLRIVRQITINLFIKTAPLSKIILC